MTPLRDQVAANPLWYHTLELAPGVVTPGWIDLRGVVEKLPWPDVRGKRCLDVGTYDGFLAFELERRGAAEVVATDISNHADWDWSWAMRERGADYLATLAGPEKGVGFEIAQRALDSRVRKQEISIYELAPDTVGEFDIVVCGSLLLHLKSPTRALEAVRSVCREAFLSAEQIDPITTLLLPRRSLTWYRGGHETQWHVPNSRGFRALVESAGFDVEQATRPYAVPFGPGFTGARRGTGHALKALSTRLVSGGRGIPHAAVLARPA